MFEFLGIIYITMVTSPMVKGVKGLASKQFQEFNSNASGTSLFIVLWFNVLNYLIKLHSQQNLHSVAT